jgi:hypothetical protein
LACKGAYGQSKKFEFKRLSKTCKKVILDRKVFGWNIKKESQKSPRYPLTSKTHLHNKHPCPMHPIEMMKWKKQI